jgi:hypothetical protein
MGRLTAEPHHLGMGENHASRAAGGLMTLLARRLLQFYWLTCAAIIVLGLNQVYPRVGHKIAWAFEDPAYELTKPFRNCAQAHYAGYFNIPRGSKAYVERQDGDGDGRSCEPYPGYPPDPLARLRVIEERLTGAGPPP